MKLFIRFLFVISVFVGLQSPLYAQTSTTPLHVRTDSSAVQPRKFEGSALSKYRAQKEFQYGTDYQPTRSLSSRFWSWFWQNIGSAVSDAAADNNAKNIAILLLAVLVIFLIIKFSGIGILQVFTGKAKTLDIPYSESLENIHEINFDHEIERAKSKSDYRRAVRMLYLKCLKRLSDSGLISWQIDKTNSMYIAELENNRRKEKFSTLTRHFEYTWYGELEIDQYAFSRIDNDFRDFNSDL